MLQDPQIIRKEEMLVMNDYNKLASMVSNVAWTTYGLQEKIDINFLEKCSGVIGWETNPPVKNFVGSTGREECVVWISDEQIADKIPDVLFNLPTTIILVKTTYRDKEEVVIKINKLPNEIKVKNIFNDFLAWMISYIG